MRIYVYHPEGSLALRKSIICDPDVPSEEHIGHVARYYILEPDPNGGVLAMLMTYEPHEEFTFRNLLSNHPKVSVFPRNLSKPLKDEHIAILQKQSQHAGLDKKIKKGDSFSVALDHLSQNVLNNHPFWTTDGD